MAANLNTAILNSSHFDSAILHKTLTQTNSIWLKLIHSHSTWRCQPSRILPLGFSQFEQKKLHSFIVTKLEDDGHLEFYHLVSTILNKKNFTHSLSLNLMMAAILKSAILDSDTAILESDTLLSSLRFTQKHSHSTLTLIQTNSVWLIWWWQPSWILPSWIQPFCTKLWLKLIQSDSNSFILTQLDDVSHLEFCHLGFHHFEQKKLHSFIVTQLDDGSHLQFYHLGFSHFAQKIFTHSFWLNLMMAAILNSAMLDSDTVILDSDTLLSSLRFTQNTLTPPWLWLKLIQSDSNSFILT